jgi:FAD synthetase
MRKKVVMAFGTFDILHPGHLSYFSRAKSLGDKLIVVVSRDSSASASKGRRPLMNEKERLKIIAALRIADVAVLGNKFSTSDEKYRIIKRYMPDVIALGYDQKVNLDDLRDFLKRNKSRAKIIRLTKPYKARSSKSSLIRRKMMKAIRPQGRRVP